MSNPLNPGDRVRYRAELVEQGFLHPRKLELTGKILRLTQGQGKCYLVKWNDVADSETTVHKSWLESVPTSGRTFEEICENLKAELHDWSPSERDEGCFTNGVDTYVFVRRNGDFEIEVGTDYERTAGWIFGANEIAAISAACTEIATNYQAEKGKENQQ